MSTIKIYQTDVYTKEWDAVITRVTPEGVYFDQTAFFPVGGGQSFDMGTVTTEEGVIFDIVDVREDGDDVRHVLDHHAVSSEHSPESCSGNSRSSDCVESFQHTLVEGDKVHCGLDWDRRFDNMQRHCGEHILSGVFYQECGGINRGFHMGDDYMTIDISLEDEPTNPDMTKPDEVTMNLALHCQLIANRIIWADTPVYVFRFDTREEAEKMPLRKKLAFDADISIVCVGSPENAADCVACCGTHPSTAGQVGLIKIYKVEKYKSMFRVYFEAGQRALRDFNMKHAMLTKLSDSYSSSIEDFPEKIRGQEQKLADVKNELHRLKNVLIEIECDKLNGLLSATGKTEAGTVIVHRLENLSIDDAFNMAKNYMGKSTCDGRLILLYAVSDMSYILVSDGNIRCGALVKEYAGFYNGKGGGNDVSARAIFKTVEDADLFADLLKKHLC